MADSKGRSYQDWETDTSDHYGQMTGTLVADVFGQGIDRAVLLMRHSAREFRRDIHDLQNPLTDHGRGLCRTLGTQLPKDVTVRGYASPAQRCLETAKIVIDAHEAGGGQGGRVRPVEALGVFYALDQMKMWAGMQSTDGLVGYVQKWFDGDVPSDAMMPTEVAVDMIVRVLRGKLHADGAQRQLDLCVSHDMTVFTVRHQLGLEKLSGPDVEFLDGLILFEQDGVLKMQSHHGSVVALS